jgi:hypothetical protein
MRGHVGDAVSGFRYRSIGAACSNLQCCQAIEASTIAISSEVRSNKR